MSIKRLLALILALTLCLSLAAPAYADNTAKVTFVNGDGTESESSVTLDQSDALSSYGNLSKPANPTRENANGKRFEFDCWTEAGSAEDFFAGGDIQRVYSDTKLTAHWKEYLAEGYELILPGEENFRVTDYETPLSTLIGNNTEAYIQVQQQVLLGTGNTNPVAQIDETKYTTLDEAVVAANNRSGNCTIKILEDIDFSQAPYDEYKWAGSTYNPLTITASNVTIDLNNHTFSNMGNCALAFGHILAADGRISNATIKNGTLNAGTTSGVKNSYVLAIAGVDNATISNVTTDGGINVYTGSTDVTVENCTVNGTKYYALCAQSGSDVTITGSTFTKNTDSSVATKAMFWVQGAGTDSDMATSGNPTGAFDASAITIEGSSYTVDSANGGIFYLSSGLKPVVKGGTYNFDPTAYLAAGYSATESGGIWTVNGPVAKIGTTGYATLEAAIAAANADTTATAANPVVVELLKDTSVSAAIIISNHVTLDGKNHTITTTAKRGVRIDTSSVTVTVKDLTISGSAMERAIQVDVDKDNVTLTIDNVTATATYYTVNICDNVDDLTLTVNNSNLTGYGVINLWGNSGTVTINNSMLYGINNASYNADGWNDFGTVIVEGDTTGQTGMHATAYDISINNTLISATQTKGNHQWALLYNDQSANNAITLTGCTIELGNNCYFLLNQSDDGVAVSTTKIKNTYMKDTADLPALDEGFIYVDVADGYKQVAEIVARIGNATTGTGYASLEDAIAAASSGDTIYLVDDIDYSTIYTVRNARDNGDGHAIDLGNLTLDLNGHTISSINATVTFGGNGATIKNGTFDLVEKNTDGSYKDGSYALIIDNDVLSYGKTGTVAVTDVVCDGGLNVCKATVTLTNVTTHTTTTKFYAVWAEKDAVVTVISGTFTDAQTSGKGVLATGTGEEGGATIDVKGGNFVSNNKLVYNSETGAIQISGGLFTKDPAAYLADGYDAVAYTGAGYSYEVIPHVHTYNYAPGTKEPDWTWGRINNAWAAAASFNCEKGDHTENVRATIGEREASGIKTITATVVFGGETYTSTKTEEQSYTVTFNSMSNSYKWGELCTLTDGTGEAPKKWVDSNGTVLADGRGSYTFPVTADISITTQTTSATEPVAAISATLTSSVAKEASFNAKWSLPSGATVNSVTIYRGWNAAEKTYSADVLKTYGTPYKANLFVRNGDYTLGITGLTTNNWQYAVIVISYTPLNGTATELVSDVVKVQVS